MDTRLPFLNCLILMALASGFIAERALGRDGGEQSLAVINSSPKVDVVYKPPHTGRPRATKGGASRGEKIYSPPETGRPRATKGGASRGEEDVFSPPETGRPRESKGGASRGKEPPVFIETLDPGGINLTLEASPILFWYQPENLPSGTTTTVTILPDDSFDPVLKTDVPNTPIAGFGSIDLSQYKVGLEPGKTYRWTVSCKTPQGQKITSSANIKRIQADGELASQLSNAANLEEKAKLLASESIWYDALANFGKLIEQNPENSEKYEHLFQSLLSAGGLADLR